MSHMLKFSKMDGEVFLHEEIYDTHVQMCSIYVQALHDSIHCLQGIGLYPLLFVANEDHKQACLIHLLLQSLAEQVNILLTIARSPAGVLSLLLGPVAVYYTFHHP